MKRFASAFAVLAALAAQALAGNIPNASQSVVTGGPWAIHVDYLNPPGYHFGPATYTLDLTTSGTPVVLKGTIDLSTAPSPPSGRWSYYYATIELKDVSGKTLVTTFNTDWLGGWYGIPAQPWDRVRQDNTMGLPKPELYFATVGGMTDSGYPNGPLYIYPSDRVYDFEMIIDPALQTQKLRVLAKGRNEFDSKQWYDIGTINLAGTGFDFKRTHIYARLASEVVNAAVQWTNLDIQPILQGPGLKALPVDLNGTYHSPSSGPMSPSVSGSSGLAVAATVPIGFGQVFERSGVNAGVDNAVNGTFTPFNDVTKLPNVLGIADANDANGTSFEADIELSGLWKPFQWGQGVGNVPPFATGDTFAVGLVNSFNSFGVQVVTNALGQYVARIASNKLATGSIATLETNGTPAVLPMGTTQIRVTGQVLGGLFSASAMPLDGPSAFTTFPLGSTDGTNMDTNSPWPLTFDAMGFIAGFETHEHVAAAADATVSNFSTDAVGNVLFLYADDPYVRSGDPSIGYRLGQANLLQAVRGFQAFMNAGSGQTFLSGAYTDAYTTFNPATIGAALDAAGAGTYQNQTNYLLANLAFTPDAAEVATGMGFRANTGTYVNLFSGSNPRFEDVPATTSNSNTVLIDNTAPTLTVPTLTGAVMGGPTPPIVAIVGDLLITMDATDLGSQQSGLAGRPVGTITWNGGGTTGVTTYSLSGNTFQAKVPITAATPNGTATLVVQVTDRAGNTSSQTVTFKVSTANVEIDVTEIGVDPVNVTRVIRFRLGADGGSSAPITVRKEVLFDTPVVVGSVNSRKGKTTITYQDLDLADNNAADNSVNPAAVLTKVYAKDPFFSLGKNGTLAGTAGYFTGAVELTMGDVTDNNIVNVSDLAVWAMRNGMTMNANTTLAQAITPRQANIDGAGIVNLGDRNIITAAWLYAGDVDGVGNFTPRGMGDGSQRIMDVVRETRLDPRLVASMDLNRDGWISRLEVLKWGARR